MKTKLLRYSAAAVFAAAMSGPALADQNPAVTDTPAGTKIMPKPTMGEDLVYLKDIVALQTIRLDEAEELIKRQNALLEAQAQQIQMLQQTVASISQGQAYASAGGTYKVKSGDTLSAIARRNNTTIRKLAEANDLKAPYPLRAGQELKLPGAPAPQIAATPTPQPKPKPKPVAVAQAPKKAEPAPQKTENQPAAAQATAPAPQPTRVATNNNQPPKDDKDRKPDALPTEVGVRPEEEEERPYLAIFSDAGGILTPRGTMFIEPSIDFTVASDNRFFFSGVEIIDAVLIGAIEATDTDRRAVSESISVKYGLTNRLEIDGRIAYVSRQDRISGVAIDDSTTSVRDLDGRGIGDAEMGLHYQLNNGRKLPYTVANLRVKAPTGTGPFDVERDPDNGIETELATGSGFWTIEPSLSFILSSDPASLYANVGYQFNLPTSPNEQLTVSEPFTSTLLDFDPGDAIRTSIGVGLSLNERLSMNFGYDQSFFLQSRNDFEIVTRAPILLPDDGNPNTPREQAQDGAGNLLYEDPVTLFTVTKSPSSTVGSFLFGGSYAINNRLRINLSGAIGATAEAPDARLSLRAQYRLFD
ncbi:LysM peptidoglycan-binding domain-containing protein [Hyphococcus sp. DH-69]|uniref:LysM peptidoglycan-binding domain-containing protein n=1 Tax=Hyphococcus formosus TaxID=3143534 RepID=UPI00398B768B